MYPRPSTSSFDDTSLAIRALHAAFQPLGAGAMELEVTVSNEAIGGSIATAGPTNAALGEPRTTPLPALAAAGRRRGGGGGGAGGGSGRSPRGGLFSDEELREIEERYAEGITAVQVVEVFVARGIRFSEATFRKYVQQGLLPRSRRVGRKGKHRGSMGMYPAKTVRRVNAIKRLMGEGHTIEEIQEQFLRYTDVIERLEEGISEVFSRLDADVAEPQFDSKARRALTKEIDEARNTADELMRRLDGLSRRVVRPRGDRIRATGAAGSAEELL